MAPQGDWPGPARGGKLQDDFRPPLTSGAPTGPPPQARPENVLLGSLKSAGLEAWVFLVEAMILVVFVAIAVWTQDYANEFALDSVRRRILHGAEWLVWFIMVGGKGLHAAHRLLALLRALLVEIGVAVHDVGYAFRHGQPRPDSPRSRRRTRTGGDK